MIRGAAAFLLVALLAACGAGEPRAAIVSGEAVSPDGVLISYEVRGSGDPALVLVHGWGNTRSIWGEHPRTLSSSHRVVTLDLAGHGESGVERGNWTMATFGDDVVTVVEQLELARVVLVGFSMGGSVVLEAAQRMPERVVGVIFVDTMHDPDKPFTAEEFAQFETLFRTYWGDTAFLRAFAFTPATPDSLIRRVAASMPAEAKEHWFPALRAAGEWDRTELVPALQRVRAPLAAINTLREPTNVEAIRRYAPSFTLDTLQGVGHAGILLERTEDFDARLLAIVKRFTSARGP